MKQVPAIQPAEQSGPFSLQSASAGNGVEPSKLKRHEAGVPAGSAEILVDGARLAVAREGKGSPIICLHATGHGGGDFEAFAAAMRDRFEIIRIDWPGQGRSGPENQPVTPARYAALVRGVVVALGLDVPIILGCSIGGAAAIVYASEYPVKALVLANTGGVHEVTEKLARIILFFASIFAAGTRGAWWYKALFGVYYRMVLPSPAAAAQRRRIVASAYEVAPAIESAWRGFAIPEEADLRQRLLGLNVPVLFAWAMQDRLNQFKAVAPVIAKTKDAKLVKFKGGHAAFLERPEEFAREFSNFVAEKKLG
jgi:pimeloyl-ACP methyl ester carboxylesterase